MELPVLNAQHEYNLIQQLLSVTVLQIALQGQRNSSGTFVWLNNEPMSFINWQYGYPTDRKSVV